MPKKKLRNQTHHIKMEPTDDGQTVVTHTIHDDSDSDMYPAMGTKAKQPVVKRTVHKGTPQVQVTSTDAQGPQVVKPKSGAVAKSKAKAPAKKGGMSPQDKAAWLDRMRAGKGKKMAAKKPKKMVK